MKTLFLFLVLSLPAWAVNVTITVGAQTETFTVPADDVASVQALKSSRVDENDECPSLKRTGGVTHDCSTGVKYLVWKIKQLVNHAKKNFPQGLDAADRAEIKVLEDKIEARKVE